MGRVRQILISLANNTGPNSVLISLLIGLYLTKINLIALIKSNVSLTDLMHK